MKSNGPSGPLRIGTRLGVTMTARDILNEEVARVQAVIAAAADIVARVLYLEDKVQKAVATVKELRAVQDKTPSSDVHDLLEHRIAGLESDRRAAEDKANEVKSGEAYKRANANMRKHHTLLQELKEARDATEPNPAEEEEEKEEKDTPPAVSTIKKRTTKK